MTDKINIYDDIDPEDGLLDAIDRRNGFKHNTDSLHEDEE